MFARITVLLSPLAADNDGATSAVFRPEGRSNSEPEKVAQSRRADPPGNPAKAAFWLVFAGFVAGVLPSLLLYLPRTGTCIWYALWPRTLAMYFC